MRRGWILCGMMVIIVLVLVSACSAAGPVPAGEQPSGQGAAEAPAADQAPAEAAVSTGDLPAGAAEYPEAPALELGNVEVHRQPIADIVTYKALPEYHEPTWVTELVDQGK